MLADINLRFLCQVFQAFFVFVELYDCLGKFVRLFLDEENNFSTSGIPSLPTEVVTMGAPL